MDAKRFDRWTKALVAPAPRRAVLRLLAAVAAGALPGGPGTLRAESPRRAGGGGLACRRTHDITLRCYELIRYILRCGVYCHGRHHPGAAGNTDPRWDHGPVTRDAVATGTAGQGLA